MKTYAFVVTPVEKEAIYMALCRATPKEYNEDVYTPELLNNLESPTPVIELTIDQLGATFRSLERARDEPGLGQADRFEEVRRSMKVKSRAHHIIY